MSCSAPGLTVFGFRVSSFFRSKDFREFSCYRPDFRAALGAGVGAAETLDLLRIRPERIFEWKLLCNTSKPWDGPKAQGRFRVQLTRTEVSNE